MFSVSPGMPGTRHEMPRTSMVIFTPARLASVSFSIMSRSVIALLFMRMRAGLPAFAFAISPSMASHMRGLIMSGATRSSL